MVVVNVETGTLLLNKGNSITLLATTITTAVLQKE